MTSFKIFLTEIRQNIKVSCTLIVVSVMIGVAGSLMLQANQKIKDLALPIPWGADIAIIPKGMTLNQLAENMKNGLSPMLLPEALFQTTRELTRDTIEMCAVLPGHDSAGPFLMKQGNLNLDLAWTQKRVQDWAPQKTYSTSEWGTNVIAAAFASGSRQNLRKLKELIDRKSIAQAFWISEVQEAELTKQAQLAYFALIIEWVVVMSLVLSSFLAAIWLYENHLHTQICMGDIGFTIFEIRKVQFLLVSFLLALPMWVGFNVLPTNLFLR